MPPGAYPPPSGFQSPPGTVQPPAGFGPPQRKKRKIWGWIVGFFVVAMLGIGSCGFVLYRAVKGPIDQANAFLAAIDDGDYRNAAAMTSSEPTCFGETAQQDIAAFFAELDITDYDLTSVNVSNTGDDATGEVSGTISFAGRPTVPIDMGLVKQRDDWKICGVVVDP